MMKRPELNAALAALDDLDHAMWAARYLSAQVRRMLPLAANEDASATMRGCVAGDLTSLLEMIKLAAKDGACVQRLCAVHLEAEPPALTEGLTP